MRHASGSPQLAPPSFGATDLVRVLQSLEGRPASSGPLLPLSSLTMGVSAGGMAWTVGAVREHLLALLQRDTARSGAAAGSL